MPAPKLRPRVALLAAVAAIAVAAAVTARAAKAGPTGAHGGAGAQHKMEPAKQAQPAATITNFATISAGNGIFLHSGGSVANTFTGQTTVMAGTLVLAGG